MAVSVGTQWFATTESIVGSIDVSVTPGSGSDMALFVVHWSMRGGRTSDACTFDPGGANEASFVAVGDNVNEVGVNYNVRIWRLLDADIVKSATNTVRAATSATGRQAIAVIELTGVDQTTPHDTQSSANPSTDTPSLIIASAVDDLVIDAVLGQSTVAPTGPGSGQTAWTNSVGTTNSFGRGASYEAGAASVTMSWSYTASDALAIVAVNVNAAAGGGPGPTTHQFLPLLGVG